MKYLPFERIVYKTRLNEAEVIKRLSDFIQPERKFRFGFFSSTTKPYEGRINGPAFEITRTISNRNSFLPVIHGIIENEFNGTTIKVKMRLHPIALAFVCLFAGISVLGCLVMLPGAFSSSEFDPVNLIPLGMLLFVYIMTMLGFKFESIKSKKDLQTLFEADNIIEE